MIRLPVLAAALVIAGAAAAEQLPRTAGFSPNVQTVPYNPMNVVRVVGSPTSSTQIIFASGEEITQVAIGDADGWLAQPAANLLFIKPTEVRPPTNAQVVTRRPDGTLRSYQLRLISVPRGEGEGAAYAVTFTYPADDATARRSASARASADAMEAAAGARLAGAWADGPRNWRYVAQGSVAIEPVEVSDNGRQTAFRFPGNARVPTIYTTAPDGSETIVPYTAVGEVVVVQTTAASFILRDGREVLRVANQGYDPVGRNPGTGTGTPELRRVVRRTRR
ncbi:TrbG/VirB9 family P-type conjugative transfer protein (plasmid) [Roseomonas sp. CCTCC AB2023176]|uniref:TrbG/VirB9 family P-type conjugative transfer protein n=1 Tax=Roseomonas sp. CCTCC AB2023176 TaxID=3342640 RepID=UPI0035D7BCCA